MRAVVAHPGLQHSHQLAQALNEAGHLLQFWSGVPVAAAAGERGKWSILPCSTTCSVPNDKKRHVPVFPIAQRLAVRLTRGPATTAMQHRIDHWFDRWFARKIEKLKPDVVICYENAALHTFEAAKRTGAVCILDAASLHHRAAEALLGAAANPRLRWISEQKDREIALADGILTCSELARASYLRAGIPGHRITACPLGAEPVRTPVLQKARDGAVRFLAAGSFRPLKGTDVLLEAFREVRARFPSANLTLAGTFGDSDLAGLAATMDGVKLLPFMPRPQLVNLMAEHDCLVLPSRFDSFGMVVAEAMAAGTPAIVSDRVGARMIIDAHPESGWIVPAERQALIQQMTALIESPDLLARGALAARRAAEDFTWDAYRKRVVTDIRTIFEAARA